MDVKQTAPHAIGNCRLRRWGLRWAWLPVAMAVIATFYPGIMSNDSQKTLEQARTFQFTDWHPPIMAVLWAGLDHLLAGPGLMLVAQAILYAVASLMLCRQAFPRLCQRYSEWVVVPVFALFPPVMVLNGMIWKDVWMSGLLLFALGHLFKMAGKGGQGGHAEFAKILALCLLATAFRHNAVAATAGMLAGAVYYLLPPWRTWIRLFFACLGGLALAALSSVVVSMVYRTITTPAHVTTPILLHDIAGIIVQSGEPRMAARHALDVAPRLTDENSDAFVARLRSAYDPAEANPLLRTTRRPKAPFAIDVFKPSHDATAVRAAWHAMVTRYPRAYLRHRTNTFVCLMQFCGIEQWRNHSYILNPNYLYSSTIAPDSIQGRLRGLFAATLPVSIYNPALWLLILGVGGISGLLRLRTCRWPLPFMAISGLGLAVSLFFTSPIESYRYVQWIIMLGWITLLLMLEVRLGAQQKKPDSWDS